MPGTPATSPRLAIPRVANTDPFDMARDINGAVDQIDALTGRFESGLLSARPSAGAGIANRYYFATDNGRLYRDAGGATPTWSEVTPQAHAASHAAGGADALTVTETMMATAGTGLAKGAFSAYRSAAITLTTGSVVPFDAEEFDVSNWFDVTTNIGRYTPQIAGYYRLNWTVAAFGALATDVSWQASLRKNAAITKGGQQVSQRPNGVGVNSGGTAIVQANGTTDFVDVMLSQSAGAAAGIGQGPTLTYFQGHLIGRA